jgi:hypothetical protein
MTEPDSPLLDKELGGRREPRTRRLKGARRPLPQAARAGTARPSFASGQMGQAAARPGLFLTVCATVILTSVPRTTQGWGRVPPACVPHRAPSTVEKELRARTDRGSRAGPLRPWLFPPGSSEGLGVGASLGRLPGRGGEKAAREADLDHSLSLLPAMCRAQSWRGWDSRWGGSRGLDPEFRLLRKSP